QAMMQQAARELSLDLAEIPVRAGDLGSGLSAVASAGADGVVVTGDPVFNGQGAQLAAVAMEWRQAITSGHDFNARDGVVTSHSADLFSIGRHSASYVDRLLKGARPDELPVEQATQFKLVINLKTAKALRLEIPPSLLVRADEVIE